MQPPPLIQVSNGKLLVQFESGLATGWKEGPAILQRSPIARPKIKMPLEIWREAVSFLVEVFDEMKIEAQCIFFHKAETNEWQIFAPWQWGTGGSTETIECVENTGAYNFLAQNGYECVGSIHSHCTMSAFQSGTDKDDEFGTGDGFHVTIGKMNDSVMDIHCRSVCTIMGDPNVKDSKAERTQVPFYLEEFIDGLPDFDAMPNPPPSRIRSEWTKYILANRDELESFNEKWMDRLFVQDPTKKKSTAQQQWWDGRTNANPQPAVNGNNKAIVGARYMVAGVEHRLVDGILEPIGSADEHDKAVAKTQEDKQWWQFQKEKEEALLHKIAMGEDDDDVDETIDKLRAELDAKIEAEEMALLRQDAEDDENTRVLDEAGRIYGIHV